MSRRVGGLALIAVLWIVILLAAIIAITAKTVRLDSHVSRAGTESVRSDWALRGGVERALAVLNVDTLSVDAFGDDWCSNDDVLRGIELENGVLDIDIIDESAKLNINQASREQLLHLEGMTDDTAAAIIDWRDENENEESSGAEAGYYQRLEVPYRIRNGRFRTVRELLLVRGVTRELFFGLDRGDAGDTIEPVGNLLSDPREWDSDNPERGWVHYLTCCSFEKNVTGSGGQRVNINSAGEGQLASSLGISRSQARWIVENRGNGYNSIGDLISESSPREPLRDSDSDEAQPIDLQTYAQIVDQITLTDDESIPGRININTAPRQVWVMLLEGNRELADAIVAQRNSNTTGMTSVADLLGIPGMTLSTFKKIVDMLTVRSYVFMIRCHVRSVVTGAVYRLEAIVERASETRSILYWFQGN